MGFTTKLAAQLYNIPLIDYERGSGTLVSSGCGIMMAVMDATRLRYCVDIDRMTTTKRLGDFMLMAERYEPPVAICGWFSLTNPEGLRVAVAGLTTPIVYAGGGVRLHETQSHTLGEFIDAIQRHQSATDRAAHE